MRPRRYPRLSFLQVPLIRTSRLLTLALLSPAFIERRQFRMKCPFLANPAVVPQEKTPANAQPKHRGCLPKPGKHLSNLSFLSLLTYVRVLSASGF